MRVVALDALSIAFASTLQTQPSPLPSRQLLLESVNKAWSESYSWRRIHFFNFTPTASSIVPIPRNSPIICPFFLLFFYNFISRPLRSSFQPVRNPITGIAFLFFEQLHLNWLRSSRIPCRWISVAQIFKPKLKNLESKNANDT